MISVENLKIFPPTPLVFCIPTEGVALEIGYRCWGQKTRSMGLPSQEKNLISSAVWTQSTNVTDGQTDGRTLDDSKDYAYA